MSNIILDKCFLQGTSVVAMRGLAASHRLLVSDGLFYELLTGAEPARSRCFAKFPQTENPVDLVSHIGTLIRKELQTGAPSGRPSENRVDLRFQFNVDLLSEGYELPELARQANDERFVELRAEAENLMSMALTIPEFFSGLLEGSLESRAASRASAEALIVTPGALNEFIASLEPPPGIGNLPPRDSLHDGWALYRRLQVQFLFALDLYVKYQGRIPELTDKIRVKLEHDILDAEVLSLGVLEGAFATKELKLIRWWNLLRRDGELYQ